MTRVPHLEAVPNGYVAASVAAERLRVTTDRVRQLADRLGLVKVGQARTWWVSEAKLAEEIEARAAKSVCESEPAKPERRAREFRPIRTPRTGPSLHDVDVVRERDEHCPHSTRRDAHRDASTCTLCIGLAPTFVFAPRERAADDVPDSVRVSAEGRMFGHARKSAVI